MGLLATFCRTLHNVPCPPPKSNLVKISLVEQMNGHKIFLGKHSNICFTVLTMWTRIFGWIWHLSDSDLTHFIYFMDYYMDRSRNASKSLSKERSLIETNLLWVTSPFPSQGLLQGPWNIANQRLHQIKDSYHMKIHPSFSAQYPSPTFDFPGYPNSCTFNLSNFDQHIMKMQHIWCVGK